MGADGEVSRCLAPPTARPSPLAKCPLRRQTPKVGAECPNRARSDLCGGRSVMGIPTAIKPSTPRREVHVGQSCPTMQKRPSACDGLPHRTERDQAAFL